MGPVSGKKAREKVRHETIRAKNAWGVYHVSPTLANRKFNKLPTPSLFQKAGSRELIEPIVT